MMRWRQSAAIRDLAAVFAFALLLSLLAAQFQLSERLNAWTHPYEHWQLDELLLALFALSLGLAWFAYRRWRESRIEVLTRRQTKERIRRLLEQNRLLARELLRLQANERRALARELHDELGRPCNAIKVDAVPISRSEPHEMPDVRASAQGLRPTPTGYTRSSDPCCAGCAPMRSTTPAWWRPCRNTWSAGKVATAWPAPSCPTAGWTTSEKRSTSLFRTVAEIAEALALGIKTVANHQARIKEKLGIATTVGLVHLAFQRGLLRALADQTLLAPVSGKYSHGRPPAVC